MKNYNIPIVIEKDRNGYFVTCPLFQGCATQGSTYEEAMENIEDAVRLHIEDRDAHHEVILEPEYVGVSMLRLAVE